MARNCKINHVAFEGLLTHKEIAETLGISRQRVMKLERNALKKLARFRTVFEDANLISRHASNG